jgi:hypothetical protein
VRSPFFKVTRSGAGASSKAIYSDNRETVEACILALTALLDKCQHGSEHELRINEGAYGEATVLLQPLIEKRYSRESCSSRFQFESITVLYSQL